MLKYIILFICCLGFSLYSLEITPDYVIVTGENPSVTEVKGEKILRTYLAEIFSKQPRTTGEKNFDGKSKAIYIGNSEYARKNGIDTKTFADEEYLIKAMPDGNLVITGGKLRGTLYGIYEFLELAGCRYFTVGEKYIPKANSIKFDDNLNLRSKPFMESRYTYLGSSGSVPRELFSWNKQNRDAAPDGTNGDFFNTRQWAHIHTFYILGKGLPDECFSLNRNGKRQKAVSANGPGQFCFTSALTRKLLKEKIGKMIEEDRKKAQTGGFNPFRLYVISPNDTNDRCFCKNCLALEKKYGAYSGVLLDFVNDIAAAFPEAGFQTDAYQWSEKAPVSGITARKNVYIQLAYLGYEWSGENDTMKPLTAPVNKITMQKLKNWEKVADNRSVWDYLVVGKNGHPAPYTSVPAIIENFKVYGKAGIKRYFSELEVASAGSSIHNMSFHDLTLYLNMKLMENPFRNTDALIADYFEKYYGPAAVPMRKLFDLLVQRQTASTQALGKQPPRQWKHADPAFLNEAEKLLDQAEAAANGDETYLRRIGFERLPIDTMLMIHRPKKGNDPINLKLVERLKKNYSLAVKRLIVPNRQQATIDNINRKLDTFINPLPLPAQFPAERTEQRTVSFGGFAGMIVNDPDAFEGKAIHSTRIPEANHKKALPQLGIFDLTARRDAIKRVIKLEEIPSDGKYHIYHIGRLKPANYMHLTGWAHYSWHMRFPLEMGEPHSEYDVYASLKFTGPAYIKGASGPSDFFIDRIFFVRQESPLPAGFDPEKCEVRQVANNPWFRGTKVTDSDAVGTKAICLKDTPERHRQPMSLGIFDMSKKRDLIKYTFKPGKMPQDEKYHLHKIGTLKKGHSGNLAGWIHPSWRLQFPASKLSPMKEYDIHVSLKLTGPAYVKDSKSPSAIYCDMVIFAEK